MPNVSHHGENINQFFSFKFFYEMKYFAAILLVFGVVTFSTTCTTALTIYLSNAAETNPCTTCERGCIINCWQLTFFKKGVWTQCTDICLLSCVKVCSSEIESVP
jgi:hypothetical protein